MPDEVFSEVFSEAAFSLEDFSADSPLADVPPAALLGEPELLSPEELSPSDSLLAVELELSPVVGVVEVVAVVEVAVVSVASFSAEVSVGGVISGVLFGVTSDTLVPPHEERPKPERSMRAPAASAMMRELGRCLLTCRAGPSAGRMWDSRSGPSERVGHTTGRSAGSPPPTAVAMTQGRAAAACPRSPSARQSRDRGKSRREAPLQGPRVQLMGCAGDSAGSYSRPAL